MKWTGGEYDAWYIRRKGAEQSLRGFENWHFVEGAFIHFMIGGVLHWLGLVDIALPREMGSGEKVYPTAFRFTRTAERFLLGEDLIEGRNARGKVHVRSNAQIHIHESASRTLRYQIARFCQWEGYKHGVYYYRVTPASLQRAKSQGLSSGQLIKLLRKTSVGIPKNLERAIGRWDSNGTQARFERYLVLRLGSHSILKALQNSKAAKYLGDPLGSSAVIVKGDAWEKVLNILAELGYLADGDFVSDEEEEN